MTYDKMKSSPSKALIIAAFTAIYIIWGSTYLGIKYAIETIPPFFMAGIRFLITGIILIVWCILKKDKFPSNKFFGIIAFSGVLMMFVGNAGVGWVEQYLPIGIAAIVVASLPLWFVALDKRQWQYNFSNKLIILGVLVGFSGILLLMLDKSSLNIADDPKKLIAFFVLLTGTICWAIGSLISKYKKADGATTARVGIQMLAAGVVSMVAGFISKEHNGFELTKISSTSLFALLYLIVMGSLVAYLSYMWLLSVRSPSIVGTYAYVNPVVAVFLGWLMLDEVIGRNQVIALCIILLGVVLVSMPKKESGQKSTSRTRNLYMKVAKGTNP